MYHASCILEEWGLSGKSCFLLLFKVRCIWNTIIGKCVVSDYRSNCPFTKIVRNSFIPPMTSPCIIWGLCWGTMRFLALDRRCELGRMKIILIWPIIRPNTEINRSSHPERRRYRAVFQMCSVHVHPFSAPKRTRIYTP